MSAASVLATALVLGTALAGGLLLVAQRIPRWAAPGLARRIAPYLRDVADPAGLTPLGPVGPWRSGPAVLERVAALWDRWTGRRGGAVLARRRRDAGATPDVTSFRGSRLAWGLGGLGAGGVLAVAAVLVGRGGPLVTLLPFLLAVGGVVAGEQRVAARARRRAARICEELPTVLEFLALCLAAGEGLRDALGRVGRVGSGALTAQLRDAVLASGTGTSLADALVAVARDADVPALSRAVEHLVAAIDRGAPLSHVLQEQAADAREEERRVLIEAAGRKEILMLLPLVFLILPLSVLFAVFPGVVMLKLGIG